MTINSILAARRAVGAPASAPRSPTGRSPARPARPRTTATRGSSATRRSSSTAVWVGYPNKLRPMLTEFHGDPVAGGTFPARSGRLHGVGALGSAAATPEYFQPPPYLSGTVEARRLARRPAPARQRPLQRTRSRSSTSPAAARRGPRTASRTRSRCRASSATARRRAGAARRAAARRRRSSTSRRSRGSGVDVVLAQVPARGTLSSYDNVTLVLAKALHGVVPKLVGLTLRDAADEAAAARAAARRRGLHATAGRGESSRRAPSAGRRRGARDDGQRWS